MDVFNNNTHYNTGIAMRIFNQIRAAFLDGKAIKNFELEKYKSVVSILERVNELDYVKDKNGIRNYYFGLSYFNLGRKKEALNALSDAYEIFIENITKNRKERYLQIFIHLSKTYIDLLIDNKEMKLANDIIIKTDNILISKGYELDFRNKKTKIIIEKRSKETDV
jgi:tetratricopeptide (TPR) repeat protein